MGRYVRSCISVVSLGRRWRAHTSGLIVSQIWLSSAANLGVVFGSTVGGGFITAVGMHGALCSGWLFAGLAIMLIALRIHAVDREGAKQVAAVLGTQHGSYCSR